MCELFSLSSRVPTTARFSLGIFSQRGSPPGTSIDGWGVALHDGRDVRLYKEPEPAGDSAWMAFTQQRCVPSRLILSHIRHATQGGIALANTQPFVRELGGRTHVFAHNGRLDGIEQRHRGEWRRFHPVGDTDSEVAFCILLERLAPLWSGLAIPSLEARLSIITRLAAEMRELGPANFLYADGDALFAHGHRRTQSDGTIAPPGLWHMHRRCDGDHDALPMNGVAVDTVRRPQEIVLLASVPLTSEGWSPFAEGAVIAVKHGRVMTEPGSSEPAADLATALA